MQTQGNVILLRREILVRLIKSFLSSDFERNTDAIPFDMRPKGAEVPFRCCIHKERAILRERAIAALGFAIEDDDDKTHIGQYAMKTLERKAPDENVLTVVETACRGCVPSRIYVSDLCQGCVARPCTTACNFGAISIKNGRSVIDGEKCKSCTKCMQVCPYNAIVKIRVPCEDACPVGAISKNGSGHASIDAKKCLSCGACAATCPFGAVAEKSQVIDVLIQIKSGKRVVAMLAPAVAGQMPVSVGQIASGLKEVGFAKVMEAAEGADITTRVEAEDFHERMERGDKFMTTSCCAAYRELVRKVMPDMKKYMSDTETPMHYTAELAKKADPDCVTVFFGPCVAKRSEGLQDPFVDYVMNFEEMGALFVAFGIELSQLPEYEFEYKSSKQARNFAVSGGVAESVRAIGAKNLCAHCVNGLNPKTVREMAMWAKKGECPNGNLVEVMVCEGGCIAGAAGINDKKRGAKDVDKYANAGHDIKPLD